MSKNFELLQNAGLHLGNGEALAPPQPPKLSQPNPRRFPVEDPHSKRQAEHWLAALRVLGKHWRSSALFAGMLMLTVIVVTFSLPPVYQPTARIQIDPPGEIFSFQGSNPEYDSQYLETLAQNLKSDKLALDVISRLKLVKDGTPAPATTDASGQTVDPYRLSPAENAALSSFQSHLKVKRDTASRLISVSFSSNNPVTAAQLTNAVAQTFIDETYNERHDSIVSSSAWLAKQLDDIRERMEESNRALAEYQKTIGVADVDANRSTFTEQMAELNRQLTLAQADRIQLEALLKSVKAGSPDVLPEIRNNPVVQQLSTRLAELRSDLSQARVIYGVNHPNVKKLQSQVNELQDQLANQKASILSSIRSSYTAARARENLMGSEIKDTSGQLGQMARYNELKKEAQVNSDLYNNLYGRIKEAGIAAASQSGNLHIVDEARVLQSPTSPNRPLDIAIGILVSLLGGVGLAFLQEQFDARLFTPQDVRDWVGTSKIAIVPLFFAGNGHALPPGAADRTISSNGHDYGKLAPGVRFLLDRPHSPEAEALRSLYTSVMLSRTGNPPQVVLVVSSFPGEGKTTVAVNLAIAMAQHGPTCLVDADLRRGRVAAAFGISSEVGLTDVLNGTAPLSQVLNKVASIPNLAVIPANAGSINAGQLVCSDVMRSTLAELRRDFQFVVVDSAPILPFADGRMLSSLADGLIFVGRSGVTTRDLVNRSLELLDEVNAAPVLEFVLNAADLNSPQYRYYQYGHKYYEAVNK